VTGGIEYSIVLEDCARVIDGHIRAFDYNKDDKKLFS
jgi:hypothetical protein